MEFRRKGTAVRVLRRPNLKGGSQSFAAVSLAAGQRQHLAKWVGTLPCLAAAAIGVRELLHVRGKPAATHTARRLDDLEQGGVGRQGRMAPQQFHASGAEDVQRH